MKAMVCPKYGPPEVLRLAERPKPVPKANEILVKVRATSVTNSDLFIRGAQLPLRLQVPFRMMMGLTGPRNEIIGEVFAGVVEQTGSKAERFRVGEQVCGLTGFSLGAYAEWMTLREMDSKKGCVAIMPEGVTFEDATGLAYGGLLALQALEPKNILRGQKVLVYGAASTSGSIAVQYAKHRGAEVTGVCSGGKMDFARSLWDDIVLDYTDDGSVAKLQHYDVAMDAVGKLRSSRLKEALSDHVHGKTGVVSIDDSALLLDSARLGRMTELVEAGAVKAVTDRVYRLEEMVEAHRYVEAGHKTGNVAISVDDRR